MTNLFDCYYFCKTLRTDFANYVRNTGYDSVRIYGPTGIAIMCNVLKRNKGRRSWTEFGSDWNLAATVNNFVDGDVLKFRFVDHNRSNLIKVTKM